MENTVQQISIVTFLLFFLGFFCSTTSLAEFSATLTGTTNYFWRGYSKTDGGLALHLNLDYEHSSGLYLGTSVVNVDFGDNDFDDEANVEITPYLGWTYNFAEDWRTDVQWTRYIYDGDIFGHQSDYNEFYLFLHYRDIVSARVSFSEDYYNQGHASGDYELTGRYPITDYIEVSAGIGYSQVKKILEYDYLYWNAGFTYYYKFVALDFRYVDATHTTNEVNNDWPYDPELIDPSFIFSISAGF
jgi:uncharacterized protein (TIGR02001 family)